MLLPSETGTNFTDNLIFTYISRLTMDSNPEISRITDEFENWARWTRDLKQVRWVMEQPKLRIFNVESGISLDYSERHGEGEEEQ